MKNILVTGAAGFIGFHLSRLLLTLGYKVSGIDNLNDYYEVSLKKSRLEILLEHENYARLADILHSLKNEDNVLFETFRQLLVDSIEGTKKSDNRQGEQDTEYKQLLALYNTLRAEYEQAPLFQVEADLDTAAEVLPEIIEYLRRGNKLVNEFGKLIPIDMDILGEIRADLGID